MTAIPLVCSFRLAAISRFKYASFKTGSFLKEARSVTITFFEIFYFLFKSFAKLELSYVFTKNMFSTAENYIEK